MSSAKVQYTEDKASIASQRKTVQICTAWCLLTLYIAASISKSRLRVDRPGGLRGLAVPANRLT